MNPLAYLLQISVLLITFSLGYYVLLRNLTFFQTNRLLLWAGLGAVLLLPLADLPDVRPVPVRNVIRKTTAALRPQLLPASQPEVPVVITYPDRKSYRVRLHNNTPQAFPWGTAVLSLYAIVTIVLLMRLAFQLRSLQRLIDRSAHEAYEDFTLVISPQTTSPFSFFKWVVINPAHHSPFEQEHILRHERVHVRQWHSVDTLVAEVLCILFWFNPAIWLFKKLVHQTLEYLADRTVLAEGVDARAYQFHLVKATLGGVPLVLATNFSQSDLKSRISMINRTQSGRWNNGWRYGLFILLGILSFWACQQTDSEQDKPLTNAIAATNPTRGLVVELEQTKHWSTIFTFYKAKPAADKLLNQLSTTVAPTLKTSKPVNQPEPVVVGIKDNHLLVLPKHEFDTRYFINGKEADKEAVNRLAYNQVKELFVMQQVENPDLSDEYKSDPQSFRLLIEISPNALPSTYQRKVYANMLTAAALSDNIYGKSFMYTMNSLLEAMFFHNTKTLVERRKDDYLKVLDEVKSDVYITINGLEATPKDVETVHVREVLRVYTREQPYYNWMRADEGRTPRFELHIQTEPKRAQRDSTYYVFSPFYQGDF